MARTVLVVDDHAGFRASRARRLVESAGFTVVGESANALDAVADAVRLHPDVVLLDVQLPDGDGFAVAVRLADEMPATVVVLTSSRDADDYLARVAEVPVAGFIGKADLSAATIVALVGAA